MTYQTTNSYFTSSIDINARKVNFHISRDIKETIVIARRIDFSYQATKVQFLTVLCACRGRSLHFGVAHNDILYLRIFLHITGKDAYTPVAQNVIACFLRSHSIGNDEVLHNSPLGSRTLDNGEKSEIGSCRIVSIPVYMQVADGMSLSVEYSGKRAYARFLHSVHW